MEGQVAGGQGGMAGISVAVLQPMLIAAAAIAMQADF